MLNALTVDLEEWFHLLECDAAPPLPDWDRLPQRAQVVTQRLLDLLDSCGVRATFFVLGWLAAHRPESVREVARRGHEIGTHGFAHELVFRQTRDAFREDLRRSLDAIEGACGVRPCTYRAPGFSVTPQTPWVFDVLVGEGIRIDSSVFPAWRAHGGDSGAPNRPRVVGSGLVEMPVAALETPLGNLPFAGGGYLRLLPGTIVSWCIDRLNDRGIPAVVYVHPRDFDAEQPRLPLSLLRHFRSYVGIAGAHDKLRGILDRHRFSALGDVARSLGFT